MTRIKSKGQNIKIVGISLQEPPFTHGQLYVAASRVGSPKGHSNENKTVLFTRKFFSHTKSVALYPLSTLQCLIFIALRVIKTIFYCSPRYDFAALLCTAPSQLHFQVMHDVIAGHWRKRVLSFYSICWGATRCSWACSRTWPHLFVCYEGNLFFFDKYVDRFYLFVYPLTFNCLQVTI